MNDVLGWLLTGTLNSAPVVFALWAALFCVRIGVFNVALEGMIILGAFTYSALWLVLNQGSWAAASILWAAVPAAGLAGAIGGAFYALCVVRLRLEPIVAGVAFNMLVVGVTGFLQHAYVRQLVSAQTRVGGLPEAGLGSPDRVLVAGVAGGTAVLAMIFGATPFGRRLTAVGSAPRAALQAGLPIAALRTRVLVIVGILCAVAGIAFVWQNSGVYSIRIAKGSGFIALAFALLHGGRVWLPFFAVVVYGLIGSVAFREFLRRLVGDFTPDLFDAIPILVTLAVLVLMSRRRGAPTMLRRARVPRDARSSTAA